MKIKIITYFVAFVLVLLPFRVLADGKEPIIYQSEINYPPYKFINNDELSGYDIDISNIIFNSEKYELKMSVDSWENVYERLKNGEIDTCGMLSLNDIRKKEILFSKPIFKTYTAAYTRKDFKKITLNELSEYRVGVGKNQYSEDLLKQKFNIEEYETYNTIDEALYALKNNEIDVLFENQEVVNYLIVGNGLKGEIIHQLKNLYPVEVGFGFSKTRPDLVEYTNNKIEELKDSGRFEEIYEKYFFRKSELYKEKQVKRYVMAAFGAVLILIVSFILIKIYINKLHKELYNEKELLNNILDNTSMFIIAIDPKKTIIKCNKNIEKFGLQINGLINKNYDDVKKIKEDFRFVVDMLNRALKLDFINNKEVQLKSSKGEIIYYSFRTSAIFDRDGSPSVILLAGLDITQSKEYESKLKKSYMELESTFEELAAEQEKLSLSEERFRLASEAANDIIWEENPEENKTYYSDRWYEILGYSKEYDDSPNQLWMMLVHPDDADRVEKSVNDHFEGKIPFYESEYRLRTKNGDYKWFLSKGIAMKDSKGKIIRFIGSSTDITQIKRFQLRLQRLAYYDSLTNLPNMTSFKEDLEKIIKHYDKAALLYIDLDNFKYINDTMGHSYGDKVLISAGNKLSEIIGDYGKLYRNGGDEFSVILNTIKNRDEVERVSESILEGFKKPIEIQGLSINISLSIGISIYPDDSKTAEELFIDSDIAMYKSKEIGKRTYTFFGEAMRKAINQRTTLEKYLTGALDNNELFLNYQPQFDVKTGKIDGFEALLRWKNPVLGMVPPLSFINVAEESGLIVPIGEWVLKTACTFIKKIEKEGFKGHRVSVNISIVQLMQEEFVERVLQILKEVNLPAESLELEITESILIKSFDYFNKKLEILKSKGIKIALDDFGTGYSSLSYLRKLKVNTLKIDKSFIDDILVNDQSKSLASTIIDIGHKVGLTVVAEGVEEEKQCEFLKNNNCDKIQGYFFSKPVSEQEIKEMLSLNN